MKTLIVNIAIFAVVGLTMALPASATITSIKSDMCGNPECTPSVVQPVVRGSGSVSKNSFMTVKGDGVDLSTGVSVNGEGVSAFYGARTFGTGSSVVIQFSVRGDAPMGPRTVTMKYLVGTDTFTIRVVRGGTIASLRRVLDDGTLVAPVNIPVNVPVQMRFAGSSIGNANISRNFDIGAKSGGCGTSETLCTFTVTFTRVGTYNMNLIDNALPSQTTQSYSKFYYAGPDEISVIGQAAPASVGPVRNVIVGVSTPPPIDAAPRASMFNLVRRISRTTPNFTRDGFAYYRLASPENLCQGMTGTQSRRVTVANPTWGVTNSGGNVIPIEFHAQLRVGTQVFDRIVPANLAAGLSTSYTYFRPGDSLLSVFTFLDQLGCFVSPTAVAFFEDPTFTVVVDPTEPDILTESNEGNNSRVY